MPKKTLIITILVCLVLSTVLVAATGCGNHKPGATETSEPAGEDNVKPDEVPGDTTPPLCSNILVTQITPKSATICWQTDEPANTSIEYGTTTDYGTLSSLQTDLVTDHSVTLDDLISGTCYHFRARSIDAAWNTGLSGDFVFTTVDTARPIITRIDLFSVKQTSAVIVWVTDELSTGLLEYGTTSSYGLTSEAQTDLRPNHTVTLNDLTAETTYHFRIRTTDASGNERISPDESFTTWLSQSRLQGKIVFCEAAQESDAYLVPYALYLIDANTNLKEKLVDFQLPWYIEDMDTAVAVSPDKSTIAYFTSSASAEAVTGSLHLFSLGTRQDVQLATYSLKTEADLDTTKAKADYRLFEKIYISWSPDGTKLAYVINRNLYVVGADGTGGTMLHDNPKHQWYTLYGWQEDQIRRPIWSSDGTHVIFDEFTHPDLLLGSQTDVLNRRLLSVDLTGQESWRIGYAVARRAAPGTNQLLVVYHYTEPEIKVILMNDDGSNRRAYTGNTLFVKNYAIAAAWSPDGTMIAAQSDTGEIEIIDASTGAVLYSISAIIGPEMTAGSFLWSPDGGYIAYKGDPTFRAIGTWTGLQVWPGISVANRELTNLLRLDAGSRSTEVWLIAWY